MVYQQQVPRGLAEISKTPERVKLESFLLSFRVANNPPGNDQKAAVMSVMTIALSQEVRGPLMMSIKA